MSRKKKTPRCKCGKWASFVCKVCDVPTCTRCFKKYEIETWNHFKMNNPTALQVRVCSLDCGIVKVMEHALAG